MTKRVLIAAGLAAALTGGSALTLAQAPQESPRLHERRGPGGPGRPMRLGPGDLGLRGINLTDTQRDQVRAILDSHKAEFEQTAAKLRDAHRSMAQATQADAVDEAAIRANSTTLANALAEQALLQAKVRTEVLATLTPEQVQQLKERRQKRGELRQRRD